MKQQTINRLIHVKEKINQAQTLQIKIHDLTEVQLPKKEIEINNVQRQLNELNNDIETIIEKINNGYQPTGCLGMLFILFGIIQGGMIGTVIFPLVGTVIGAVIGGFLFRTVSRTIRKMKDSLLICLLPKKASLKHQKKINDKKLEARESLLLEKDKKIVNLDELKGKQFKLIDEKNQLVYKITNMNKALLSIERPTFLGLDYCEIPILDYLIDLLNSGRADTLKEALNLYEEQLHKDAMIELQRQQIQLSQKTVEQQQEILNQQIKQSKQLRYGNTLNTLNTVRHWSKSGQAQFKK